MRASAPADQTQSATDIREGRLRSLYVCYFDLDDPLFHTQVVAYLEGLAAVDTSCTC